MSRGLSPRSPTCCARIRPSNRSSSSRRSTATCSRAKDDIGRALLENKHQKLGFLHCDVFIVSEETKSLVWPKEASTSDAVLLAGLLQTNTTLTSFNIATGATLENKARSALGEALLSNENARVAFCNDFGLAPNVDSCEFDLSRTELKEVEPFLLLAGCLRGNRTLTHVTLMQLRMEQISTLALALRSLDPCAARHHPHDAYGRPVRGAPRGADAQRLSGVPARDRRVGRE